MVTGLPWTYFLRINADVKTVLSFCLFFFFFTSCYGSVCPELILLGWQDGKIYLQSVEYFLKCLSPVSFWSVVHNLDIYTDWLFRFDCVCWWLWCVILFFFIFFYFYFFKWAIVSFVICWLEFRPDMTICSWLGSKHQESVNHYNESVWFTRSALHDMTDNYQQLISSSLQFC